ncbi:SDR family oxidoreductase [Paludibacterium yongneupense]|uniref:SDR family oxidoreductase n=1 Tax=Paludibacterium yongneupense TaxID=400061 RepID=UPI00041D89F8|nr:SDR family oxidoreductase [Paludibacterium yongneupense]
MPASPARILITGASGQLGRLVVHALLQTIEPARIVAAVRDTAKAGDLAALGIEVRRADYTKPETLDAAFVGIDRLLLISSSEVGQRLPQHRNVIDAAKRAGVKLLAYTSLLHADSSPLGLAEEHRQTEAAIRASGLPFALLRNGWYSENYAASIPSALQHGAHIGSAAEGRIASAARADYAAAAAAVLSAESVSDSRIYELAGDDAYTLTQFAAEITKQSGRTVIYQDMPEAAFRTALTGAGLPEAIAQLLADSDAGAARGGLFDDSHQLSTLIGRPTTPLAATVAQALQN